MALSHASAYLLAPTTPQHVSTRVGAVSMLKSARLPAPPTKPPTRGGGGDGDGEGLTLIGMDASERRALLTVWKWQAAEQQAASEHPDDSDLSLLTAMINWEGEEQTGGPMSKLKGRALEVRLGDDAVGLVLLRYELDKSSLVNAMSCRHVMVVEGYTLTPSLSSRIRERTLLEAGLQRALMQLGECHSQRVEFSREMAIAAEAGEVGLPAEPRPWHEQLWAELQRSD